LKISKTEGHATYLYCILRSARPPQASGLPRGLPDVSAPRFLEVSGDTWLAAADAPLAVYGAQAIEARLGDLGWVSARAVAHEAVVERCAALGPVIPMKSFTLFDDAERAVEHVRRELPRLEAIFRRVAGRKEWGLRVHLAGSPRTGAGAAAPARSGTEFLAHKKASRDAARERVAQARRETEELYADLAAQASAAVRHAPPEGVALLLDAAFLVADTDSAEFQRRLEGRARRLADRDCSVTLTGPWPPYNFVGEDRGRPA
jgi:hypothetical protein